MDDFEFFILYRLPYLACPFYLIMLGVRIWVWMRFYNPALKLLPRARGSVYGVWKRQYRPTIHIFPGSRSQGTEWKRAIKGFVFFTGLYKRDKVLWLGSWSLHLGLFLVIVAHVRVILPPDQELICLRVALTGSGLMTVSGTYLLLRRIIVQRVRENYGLSGLSGGVHPPVLFCDSISRSIRWWRVIRGPAPLYVWPIDGHNGSY